MALVCGLCLLTACDKDASRVKYESDDMVFFDTLRISLYTPDAEIENDPQCVNKMLSTSADDAMVYLYTGREDHFQLYTNDLTDMVFTLPYLNENHEVRTMFRNGMLAKLYYRLRDRANTGKMDKELFKGFQISVMGINDTITIQGIKSSFLPVTGLGVSAITWNEGLNSNYVSFSLDDASYTRRSSIYNSLALIADQLEQWKAEGDLSAEEIAALESIRDQRSGMIKNCKGLMAIQYVNYHVDVNMQIEQADGLLDKLSEALYGKDSDKKLWFVIDFSSNFIKSGGYHEVE